MDVKIRTIESWLLPLLSQPMASKPFIVGLSGVQGSGKSTIVAQLHTALELRGIRSMQFSLDDLYLRRADQEALAKETGLEIFASRGQFGTHDTQLARDFFRDLLALKAGEQLPVPSYDKSKFNGRGDRAEQAAWPTVEGPLDVVLFEGWGVGFQPLSDADLWQEVARLRAVPGGYGQVAKRSDAALRAVNDALRDYCHSFMGRDTLDALVVLQAQEIDYVYRWRLQQEHAMWAAKGTGMTDAEVKAFIDRYYSSYELYLPKTVQGIFNETKLGRQLNILMDQDRRMLDSVVT